MVSQQLIEEVKKGQFRTKLRAGGKYVPVQATVEGNRIVLQFGYYPPLLAEIKESFEGRYYHGYKEGDGRKVWSFPITFRNLFQLEVLMGKYGNNPYAPWEQNVDYTDRILEHFEVIKARTGYKDASLYQHQINEINFALNGHWVLLAAEMGTGKTLSAIILYEMCGLYEPGNLLWVGTTSSLVSTKVELRYWRSPLAPRFYTYAGMRRLVEEWPDGVPAPRLICFDEISRCKNPAAQQTKACKHTADSARYEYGWKGSYILGLSGTPAPKSPVDWWSVCEVICPGFLREKDIHTFRSRLGYFEEQENPVGGTYSKLIAWKDGEDRCDTCGKDKTDPIHHMEGMKHGYHPFRPGKNEVTKLKKRLNGLVGVWLKKDCLDLPEKRYELHRLTPSQEILNAARLAVKSARRTVDALIRLRTISDGFIYQDEKTGKMIECPGCDGSGTVHEYCDKADPTAPLLPEEIKGNFRYVFSEPGPDDDPLTFVPSVTGKRDVEIVQVPVKCYQCEGSGEIEKIIRATIALPTPKLDLTTHLLDEHSEVGRFVIYAGFQGSIDRIEQHALQYGWTVLRADGRGWQVSTPMDGKVSGYTRSQALELFQHGQDTISKMLFLGQPGAAGMGLTLTASPSIFFYSNDFVPENRQQAEDRGHRLSMDRERGGRIIDVIHLPTDEKVITSLKESKKLQLMSLTGLSKILEG